MEISQAPHGAFNISGHSRYTDGDFNPQGVCVEVQELVFAENSKQKTFSGPRILVSASRLAALSVHVNMDLIWEKNPICSDFNGLDLCHRGKQGEYDAPGHLCPLSEGMRWGPCFSPLQSTRVVTAG